MTEKVKIPQEVADAIQWIASETGRDHEDIIRDHAVRSDRWMNGATALNNVPFLTLVDALRIGYEVEQPPIYVGDFAARIKSRRIIERPSDRAGVAFRVSALSLDGNRVTGSDGFSHHVNKVRHATPEEIKAGEECQKWAGIEEGDVLAMFDGYIIGTFVREIDGETIVVNMSSGPCIWRKEKVELYAKKVGASNA